MRYALSSAAALSGLVLFGIAIFGEPGAYVRVARVEWNNMFGSDTDSPLRQDAPAPAVAATNNSNPTASPIAASPVITPPVAATPPAPVVRPPEPPSDAEARQIAALRREVLRLQQQLATVAQPPPPVVVPPAPPADAASATSAAATPEASAPAPAVPIPPPPAPPPPAQSTSVAPTPAPVAPLPPAAASSSPAAVASNPPLAAAPAAPAPPASSAPASPAASAPPTATAPPPPAAAPPAPVPAQSTRPQVANAGPGPDKADRAAERAPAVAERREKPETAASRRAQIKATPLPPPAPAPPDVPRAEGDDARAVLARLRQSTSQEAQHPPAQAMAPAQATAPAQAVAPAAAPRGPVSPFVVRLNDARAALGVGRLDDARRLLQEVQLSLVFRPVGPDGAELPNASTGAADVARALEALGVNDVQRGRQYVDRALDAVTGAPIRPQASAGDGGNRSSGYAPAYPPR